MTMTLDVELIDFHTHTFPTPERGIGWLRSVGQRNPERTGTIDELLSMMSSVNISRAVMLSYTPTRYMYEARLKAGGLPEEPVAHAQAERQIKATMVQRAIDNNEWSAEQTRQHPELVSFCGIDPVYMTAEQMLAEIDDKLARGASGVKIVPIALEIYGNDRRLWPVYEHISRLGVPLLSQAGGRRNADGKDAWGAPQYFAEPLEAFPRLTVIMAHLAHGYEKELTEMCRRFPGFHADLSMRLHDLGQPGQLSADELVDLIRACGPAHVLHGSNFPICDPVLFAEVVRKIGLSRAEQELIFNGNARRILNLS